ncbi:MAG TPA: glycosyltransferase [Thermodesulfovibrionales bacterium]|nr:glycosyltransferase [Thermodesulfovibrionales bacterium]
MASVIIPVYNGERYLSEAIESVLAQDYRPLEVIVVNDGSTDNTETVARRYGDCIFFTSQENRGPAAARNRGLRMARGEMVGFLDADDLWLEDKLSLQIAFLKKSPSVEIIVGLTQRLKSGIGRGNESIFEKWLDPFLTLSLGAAVFRKSVFKKVGFFDETFHYGEDVDWFIRAREQGVSIAVMEYVFLLYRFHQSNMTRNATVRDSYFVRTLKKSLDRRRRGGYGSVAPFSKLTCFEALMNHPPRTTKDSESEPE